MFEVFKAFLDECAEKGEEEPEDLMDISDPLEVCNPFKNNLCGLQLTASYPFRMHPRNSAPLVTSLQSVI
jgi:hypothetical protein